MTPRKKTPELIAILDGREMGRVTRDNRARLTFTYNEDWRTAENAYPLSISMPLALAQHANARIDTFLWGLLPDNQLVLDQWARKFHVSARNAFSLVSAVGEDCAGAVQFVRPERLEAILGAVPPEIEWLTEANIAQRLRALREGHSAWRIPSARIPTTHILKPPLGEFAGHAENEHFCLELARALGLPVVDSRIMRFGDEVAIVVERYDRIRTDAGLRRVHQEDICQALGIPPTSKYQNEGGPGIRDIVELLRTYSGSAAEDVRTFLDSVAFNWLIVGTDAHAKNYALLIGSGGRVRLAPLYDLASVFPYPRIDIKRVKLSMKLGGEYRFRNIQIRHWRRQAEELGVNPDELVHRVDELAMQLTDHVPEVERRMTEEGLTHPLIHRLAGRLTTRAAACRKLLRG